MRCNLTLPARPVCRALGSHISTPALLSTQNHRAGSENLYWLLSAYRAQIIDTGTLRSIGSRPCPRTCKHVCLQPGRERGLGENGSCLRMAESLRCSPEPITALFISCTPMQNKKVKKYVCLQYVSPCMFYLEYAHVFYICICKYKAIWLTLSIKNVV